MTADVRECPFCGEIIKAKARKCRFCNEFLELGLTREAVLIEEAEEQAQAAAQGTPHPAVEEKVQAVPVASEAAPAPADAAPIEGETPAATEALNELYQKLAQMPDSPEKDMVTQALKKLEAESQKGDEADESAVENLVEGVVDTMPDIAEIVVNTIINPASGVTTLVQKVAKRVAKRQQEKAAEETAQEEPQAASAETQAQEDAEPATVDTEAATEVLDDLHQKLEQMPDSPEKEAVAQAVEQLEAESQKGEEADKGTVKDLIVDVAKALPEVGEAVVETAQKVAESQEE